MFKLLSYDIMLKINSNFVIELNESAKISDIIDVYI